VRALLVLVVAGPRLPASARVTDKRERLGRRRRVQKFDFITIGSTVRGATDNPVLRE
jgi:hypothetical protein